MCARVHSTGYNPDLLLPPPSICTSPTTAPGYGFFYSHFSLVIVFHCALWQRRSCEAKAEW